MYIFNHSQNYITTSLNPDILPPWGPTYERNSVNLHPWGPTNERNSANLPPWGPTYERNSNSLPPWASGFSAIILWTIMKLILALKNLHQYILMIPENGKWMSITLSQPFVILKTKINRIGEFLERLSCYIMRNFPVPIG